MPYWRLFYHFVWGTKKGEPFIESEWEDSLHNVIAAKAAELEALVYAVGGTDNHIHLVASVPPKVALSAFIGQVKGSSSHWVNHELNPGYQFAWQSEYGVVSFGGKQLDMVVRYAKNQRAHHAEGTAIPMLESVAPSQVGGAEPPALRGQSPYGARSLARRAWLFEPEAFASGQQDRVSSERQIALTHRSGLHRRKWAGLNPPPREGKAPMGLDH